MVNGTGTRFQNREDESKPYFYEGEIRFAFTSVGEGRPFELVGMWVQRSWKECAQELYNHMSTDRLEVFICDGDPGIEEAFIIPEMRVQRCQWHGKRDLSFILYQDGVKKTQQQEIMDAFAAAPLIGLRRENIESLRKEDAEMLCGLRKKTLHSFCDLYFSLQSKGYHNAAVYMKNLAQSFVSFIDHIIETGMVIPATSNIIEGKISLLKTALS